jgi:hypothetical protein
VSPLANPLEEAGPPINTANVTPIDAGTAQTRQIVDAVRLSVASLHADVKEIRDYRYTDLWRHLAAFATGIVLVVGMMSAVYFKIEDKIQTLSTTTTRIQTKPDDLIARVPPIQAPVPRK